nr:hypothetical protein CFP56_02567 [Quercus suber]
MAAVKLNRVHIVSNTVRRMCAIGLLLEVARRRLEDDKIIKLQRLGSTSTPNCWMWPRVTSHIATNLYIDDSQNRDLLEPLQLFCTYSPLSEAMSPRFAVLSLACRHLTGDASATTMLDVIGRVQLISVSLHVQWGL